MFLYSNWQRLPISTRIAIASVFNIPKVGSTHVVSNEIQTDGFPIHLIEEALNLADLQFYLKTDEPDINKLWTMLIDKVEGRSYAPVTPKPMPEVVLEEVLIVPIPQAPVASTTPENPPKGDGKPPAIGSEGPTEAPRVKRKYTRRNIK